MDELSIEREDVVQLVGEMHMTILGLQRENRRLHQELAERNATGTTNGHAHIDTEVRTE